MVFPNSDSGQSKIQTNPRKIDRNGFNLIPVFQRNLTTINSSTTSPQPTLMKTAKSLIYGGELIDAIDCSYDDFKRLAPLCPNCSNPVYLRAGGDRISTKGTEYKISQHWAHFAGKSAEEVAACELRVNGYSDADREKIQRIARGQREKWIRRWLWRAFEDHLNSRGLTSQKLTLLEGLKSVGIDVLAMESPRSAVDVCAVEHFLRDDLCFDELGDIFSRSLEKTPTMLEGIDLVQHEKIFKEITLYLKTKKQKGTLNALAIVFQCVHQDLLLGVAGKIIGNSALRMSDCNPSNISDEQLGKALATVIHMHLYVVPWASEFARLEAFESAKQIALT
jgi:hypothetical protein